MQNANNKNKLKIKQYTPPSYDAADSTSALTAQDPLSPSTAVVKKKEGQRGSFKNKSNKLLTLLHIYYDKYPPRAPYGEVTATWHEVVDALNSAFPNDVPVHLDACKKAIKDTIEQYQGTFSQQAAESNTGSARRSTPLEQAAYDIWCKQQEEKDADDKKWNKLRASQARRKKAQEDLKRKLILNDEKKAKRIRAHNSPGTSMETEGHVMIDVEPEETFETASPQIKDEVAGESSQQQTFHKLDNSFYSGETVDDENDAAFDQQFVEEQRLFQEDSIALQRESVALQKAILEALQELNSKISKDQ